VNRNLKSLGWYVDRLLKGIVQNIK